MTTATKKPKARTTLDVRAFKAAMSTVGRAVPARGPKPIYTSVLLCEGTLTGSDGEVRITTPLAYTGEPLLLPYARLSAILNSSPADGDIVLDRSGSSCTVRIGRGTWTLPTEDAAEYPSWAADGLKSVCRLPADQFCRAVRGVVYATDNESSRYALGAVLVDFKGGAVTFVATDGRRLSAYEVECDQALDDTQTLIPAGAIRTMSVVAGHAEAVQLEANDSECVCTIDDTVVTARLTAGRFPRWSDVFPETDAEPNILDRAELMSATAAAAICTSEQSRGVTFTFAEDAVSLTSRSSENGEAFASCSVLQRGTPGLAKMDPSFLLEFGRSCDEGEPLEVTITGKESAVVLRCGDLRGVVMPMSQEG